MTPLNVFGPAKGYEVTIRLHSGLNIIGHRRYKVARKPTAETVEPEVAGLLARVLSLGGSMPERASITVKTLL